MANTVELVPSLTAQFQKFLRNPRPMRSSIPQDKTPQSLELPLPELKRQRHSKLFLKPRQARHKPVQCVIPPEMLDLSLSLVKTQLIKKLPEKKQLDPLMLNREVNSSTFRFSEERHVPNRQREFNWDVYCKIPKKVKFSDFPRRLSPPVKAPTSLHYYNRVYESPPPVIQAPRSTKKQVLPSKKKDEATFVGWEDTLPVNV